MIFVNEIAWKIIAALLLNAHSAAGVPPDVQAILQLRHLDQRVAATGHRLATANLPLCGERQFHPGFQVHDLSQYPRAGRALAVRAFGLRDSPAILALVDGSPAERAGLRLDDGLLAADGAPLPRPPADPNGSYAPTERIIEAIEAAFADGSAQLAIRRDGQTRNLHVEGQPGCASRFQLVPSRHRHAQADGRYVQLTSALVEYTRDDNELAALVAHELAHNILRHRERLNQAGVKWDLPSYSGRDARLFQQTELEATRLGVHLMDRAGYDPQAAVRLWTRQSADSSGRRRGTHPDWPTRIAALESEIRAIAVAKAAGREPVAPISHAPLMAQVE